MAFAACARNTNAGIERRQRLAIAEKTESREALYRRTLADREAKRIQSVADAIEQNTSRDRKREERIAAWYAEITAVYEQGRFANRAKAIIAQISEVHGVSVEDITGPRRSVRIVTARQHAVYEVARQCPDLSLPRIGRAFNRDHTTALASLRVWPEKAAKLGFAIKPLNRNNIA